MAKATHRPEEHCLGQYIINCTSELFPDVVGRLNMDYQQDYYKKDNRIDGYLHELFDKLKEQ